MLLSDEHIGHKIPAKIQIYILTWAELLITLWYEIPCMYPKISFAGGNIELDECKFHRLFIQKCLCIQDVFFVGGLFRVGGLLKTYWQGCNFLVDLTAFDVATEFISQACYFHLSNKRADLLRFSFFEKATKVWKNSPTCFDITE